MYVSERITNIKELENIISRAYTISQILSEELTDSSPDIQKVKALSESITKELRDASNFEICIVRRESIWMPCSSEQREGGEKMSFTKQVWTEIDIVKKNLAETERRIDMSFEFVKYAERQARQAKILSILALAVSVITAIINILYFV